MQYIFTIGIAFLLMNEAYSMVDRSFAPRSVPGRIKSSADPFSLKDYFLNYLSTVRQHQQPQYGMTEYEPPFLRSFYNKHQFTPEALAALQPYLSQFNAKDYSYDYNELPNPDSEDRSWYANPDSDELNIGGDRSSQNAALLHLFLDNVEDKYSLEDLETLEREAAIEDNNENQLQALMAKKKAMVPLINFMPSIHRERLPFRQGQKEEVIMQPTLAIRRPVFNRTPFKQEKAKKSLTKSVAKAAKKEKSGKKLSDSNGKHADTIMEPRVQKVYHSLQQYLERERMLRQAADEQDMIHTTHKRFISEPKALSEQLVNLKKTIS